MGNVAGLTGHNSEFTFEFLDDGVVYDATVYSDAPDSHYNDYEASQKYEIKKFQVTKQSEFSQYSAPGGGFAVSLFATEDVMPTTSAPTTAPPATTTPVLTSPNGKLELSFGLNERGRPTYSLNFEGRRVTLPKWYGY